MLLSDIVEKNILVGKTPRGVCRGIGVSLKSRVVKYLLCSNTTPTAARCSVDFSVSVSAVEHIGDAISLNRLRSVLPKNCAKVFLGCPVYSCEGGFLGNVLNVELDDFIASRLFTDRGESFPMTAVIACSDVILLRKEQPFPIGQRIPAPLLSTYFDKYEGIVTKPVLREAMKKGALIKLTLSLPPFSFDGTIAPKNASQAAARSNGIFSRKL